MNKNILIIGGTRGIGLSISIKFLQEKNILFRNKKAILFNNSINRIQRPANSKKVMSNFLEKTSIILSKETWFGR